VNLRIALYPLLFEPDPCASQAVEKPLNAVILSEDFMILRLTTAHENVSAGILPAASSSARCPATAGRMPALPHIFKAAKNLGSCSFNELRRAFVACASPG